MFEALVNFFRREEPETEQKWEILPDPVNHTVSKPKALTYMQISFATDKGLVRQNNEDNFYIDGKYTHSYEKNETDHYVELTQSGHLFALFDGMGGEAFGETASALAALQIQRFADDMTEGSVSDLPYQMNEFTRSANSAICDMLKDRSNARGGSTFAAICVKDGMAYPFYLGDSRIYIYDEQGLSQITEDQTLAIRNIKAGVYTEEEARNSPDHHKLTGYLGADYSDMGLDSRACMPFPMNNGMKILLCTDGLTDMCSSEEIAELLEHHGNNPARELADLALKNGGQDNVTCIVIESKTELL